MEKKYLIGAALVGVLFIGGAWLLQDDGATSKHNSPDAQSGGQVYQQPASQQAKPSGGDANF